MKSAPSPKLMRVLTLAAGLLVVKTTAAVVLGYRNYFPPDFDADFLRGRELDFFHHYQWYFYVHIVSGPISLALGLLLLSDRFRMRYPGWHRRLGRIQAMIVLLLVSPSGLGMARHAAAGPVAGAGFAMLALSTGACVALGWRAAVQRRFAVHRRWMWRCFLLLCSAVVIRVAGGAAVTLGVSPVWFDPVAAWASWLAPLIAFEAFRFRVRRSKPRSEVAASH